MGRMSVSSEARDRRGRTTQCGHASRFLRSVYGHVSSLNSGVFWGNEEDPVCAPFHGSSVCLFDLRKEGLLDCAGLGCG